MQIIPLSFLIVPIPASFSLIFVFSMLYNLRIIFCDVGIRTADLWCRKPTVPQPLCFIALSCNLFCIDLSYANHDDIRLHKVHFRSKRVAMGQFNFLIWCKRFFYPACSNLLTKPVSYRFKLITLGQGSAHQPSYQ